MAIQSHSHHPDLGQTAQEANRLIQDALKSLPEADHYDYGGHDIKIGEYEVHETATRAMAEAQQARDTILKLAEDHDDPTLNEHFDIAADYFASLAKAAEISAMLHGGHGSEEIVRTLENFARERGIEEGLK